jgi:hypothetical protein
MEVEKSNSRLINELVALIEDGKNIVVAVSRQLTTQYGKSFEEKSLRRMMQFAQIFNDEQIVVSVIRQSVHHFITIGIILKYKMASLAIIQT